MLRRNSTENKRLKKKEKNSSVENHKKPAKKVALPVKIAGFKKKENEKPAQEKIQLSHINTEKEAEFIESDFQPAKMRLPEQVSYQAAKNIGLGEREKKIIMAGGVIFFMTLILIGWIINLRGVLQSSVSARSNNAVSFDEISQDWSRAIEQIRGDLDKVNNFTATGSPGNIIDVAGQPILPVGQEKIATSAVKELKDKLESAASQTKN